MKHLPYIVEKVSIYYFKPFINITGIINTPICPDMGYKSAIRFPNPKLEPK